MQSKQIFYRSILFSLVLHGLSLWLFQHYSLWISPERKPPSNHSWTSTMKKESLASFVREIVEASNPPKKTWTPTLKITPLFETKEHPSFSFEQEKLLTLQRTLPKRALLDTPIDLPLYLPKEILLSSPLTKESAAPPPTPHWKPYFYSPLKEENPSSEILLTHKKQKVSKEIPSSKDPLLLPHFEEFQTLSCSHSFEAELVFIQRETDYLFAITLIPKKDLDLPKFKQHYTFILNRSNSIQEKRLHTMKQAIYKALGSLDEEDSFNVLIFDSKMEKLSSLPLSPTEKNRDLAKAFLDKVELGSFFSNPDVYKPLLVTIPSQTKEDEVHTVVLLTDGEVLLKKEAERALLGDWTFQNQGKVSLFTLGIGSDVHLRNLECASILNRGRLFHSPTKTGIKRKLLKLMKMAKTPIAKELSCMALSEKKEVNIEIFPKVANAPHLYLDEPYVILGSTPSLDDFTLFVQAKLKDQWMHIKKRFSFLEAKKGNASLHQEWALFDAFDHVARYFYDEDKSHLALAKELLESFHMQADFR